MVTEFLGHRRIPNRVPSPVDVLHFCRCTGFETAIVKSVSVVAGETTTLELKLRIGKPNENVEVSDAADLAQTESATLGRAIDERAIESLPLANRNYTQLIALSPGVVVELPNAAALGRNNQNVSANGSKTTANNIQFNGIDANNLSQNSASGYQFEVGTAVPSPDTIEEFKVQTGNYDAGYGRGAGANVDLISRSGHSKFHGSAWEYLRKDTLNANDSLPRGMDSRAVCSGSINSESQWAARWLTAIPSSSPAIREPGRRMAIPVSLSSPPFSFNSPAIVPLPLWHTVLPGQSSGQFRV